MATNSTSRPLLGNKSAGMVDNDSLVKLLNDEMATLLIPATVFISLLMVLGFVGNLFVCYYYTFQSKRSTNSFFIVILAIYDLIACSISMPTEIADIEHFYTFENNVACKILRFFNYFVAIASGLTLVAIATDRFKRICRVTKPQMDMAAVRRVSVIICVIAILLSWPSFFLYGAIRVPIENEYDLELFGHDCTTTKDKNYSRYVWMFNGAHFLLFVFTSAALIILYSIIGRTIYLHRKRINKYKHSDGKLKKSGTKSSDLSTSGLFKSVTSSSEVIDENCTKSLVQREEVDKKPVSAKAIIPIEALDKRNTHSNKIEIVETKHHTTENCQSDNKDVNAKSVQSIIHVDAETLRVTLVMILVTVVFITSFLPHLMLVVGRAVVGKHEPLFLSPAGLVVTNIFGRSFLLNSSLNPWIYGIFNSKFRQFYFGWCCRKMYGSN